MTDEIDRLKEEIWHQWEYNHSEHCGKPLQYSQSGDVIGPHDGECHWPLPDVLGWPMMLEAFRND